MDAFSWLVVFFLAWANYVLILVLFLGCNVVFVGLFLLQCFCVSIGLDLLWCCLYYDHELVAVFFFVF
jgi:hypothetical protein